MLKFEEKMRVCYKNISGKILYITNNYFTFTPFDTSALIVVYKNEWKDVTVLQVAQDP